MLRKIKRKEPVHLPCAGITLFRFYGYYLSHPGRFNVVLTLPGISTPRTLFPPAMAGGKHKVKEEKTQYL